MTRKVISAKDNALDGRDNVHFKMQLVTRKGTQKSDSKPV